MPPDRIRRRRAQVLLALGLVVVVLSAVVCYLALDDRTASPVPAVAGSPGAGGCASPGSGQRDGGPSDGGSPPSDSAGGGCGWHSGDEDAVPALKDVFADRFLIGAEVGLPQLTGAQADLLRRQFDSLTPGTALKWSTTEPAENSFDFTAADTIVAFASAHGIQVRGHTLIWYKRTPDWVFRDASGEPMTPTPKNKALLLSRLEQHITTEVSRYRGKIYAWDVVNEALGDDGSLRESRWYRIAGLDYIRDAFVTAHAADPDAELCINDYGLAQPTRREAMYRLVHELLAEGVPITCIGNQLHATIAAPTADQVATSIDRFATLGVDQQITELDMSVYTDGTSSYAQVPASVLARQARRYRKLFDVFRSRQAAISSVTLWGVSDADTWLDSTPFPRQDAPLLFDADLRPKPAFWAVVGAKPPP